MFLLRRLIEIACHGFYKNQRVPLLQVELEIARLHAVECHQLVNQTNNLVSVGYGHTEALLRIAGHGLVLQKIFQRGKYEAKGCFQLMRYVGEELHLFAVKLVAFLFLDFRQAD